MNQLKQALNLSAKRRDVIGKQVKKFRQSGWIPAVMYGHGLENQNILLPTADVRRVYNEVGNSALVDISIDGETQPIKVIIQDVSVDPVHGSILHADLHRVNLKEKITTDIELVFTGISKAVKEDGGILVKNMDRIEVECLPTDLVQEISVPLELLTDMGSVITIGQLQIPKGITVKVAGDEVVATVQAPRSEAELEALQEKPVVESVADVELVKKEKKVDEEAAVSEKK